MSDQELNDLDIQIARLEERNLRYFEQVEQLEKDVAHWKQASHLHSAARLQAAAKRVELEKELEKAVQYLRQGKALFAPNTTNSIVDEFLEKHSK
jgi:DNA-directed RNA polymerase subunit F